MTSTTETTTTFGIDTARVRTAIDAITHAPLGLEDTTTVFARVAWTHIAEPGDEVAGFMVDRLGASKALALVMSTEGAFAVSRELNPTVQELGQYPIADIDDALNRWRPRADMDAVMAVIRQTARNGIRVMTPMMEFWPDGLSDLGNAQPHALFYRGSEEALEKLNSNSMAIIGARAATGYGEHLTMEFASQLAEHGVTVVSGGAYGIDGMAHRATLASKGNTVAVLAAGLDRFYPAGHEALLTRVSESGVVISEMPVGSKVTKNRFLQSNRLIAAMTHATLVVEAGHHSGSLSIATYAKKLDRRVGAVPGPVTSAASAGCHRLIRHEGAILVSTPAEALDMLRYWNAGIDNPREIVPVEHAVTPNN